MRIPIPEYAAKGKFLPCRLVTHPLPDNPTEVDNRFASIDDPALFKENLKKSPPNWHYRTKEIRYIVNSEGYRTKEWNEIDWKNSIVLFGCSNVTGIGVAEDETISHHLSNLTGRYVVNLGIPGSSIMAAFYNSLILAENYPTPWAVVFSWTGINRFPIYKKHDLYHSGPWDYRQKNRLFREWNLDEVNPIMHSKFAKLAAKNLWSSKTKYYDYSLYDDVADYLECDFIQCSMLTARDKLHPGYDATPIIAQKIFENLKD